MQNHCSISRHLTVPRCLLSTFLAPQHLMGTRWVPPYFSVPARQSRCWGIVLTPLIRTLSFPMKWMCVEVTSQQKWILIRSDHDRVMRILLREKVAWVFDVSRKHLSWSQNKDRSGVPKQIDMRERTRRFGCDVGDGLLCVDKGQDTLQLSASSLKWKLNSDKEPLNRSKSYPDQS